ncbi:hypothetical protein [Shewanella sp.]|uniref:hypothetical protein n=1 Tax=Shewanella sp. TaxID=50422 RepID=UPI003A97284D
MLTSMVMLVALSAAPSINGGLFETKLQADGAQVTTSHQLPQSAWEMACRNTLTSPQRQQLQQQLGQQLNIKVPAEVSYFAGDITQYRQWKDEGWLHCRGDVQPKVDSYQLPMLAVRVAWWADEHQHKQWLRPLLQLALTEPDSTTDAMALIAANSSPGKALAAVQQLDGQKLQLPQAMLSVAKLLQQGQKLAEAQAILARCDEVACRKLTMEIEHELERKDETDAENLDCYFSRCTGASDGTH